MRKLLTILLCLFLLFPCSISHATEREPYLYLDIPFAELSFEELADLLLTKKQVILEQPYSTADASGLADFGHTFQFSAFYDSAGVIERIVLTPEGEAFAAGEAFSQLVNQQILQFVDLDQQLTDLYGEPDIRFFWAGEGKYQMTLHEAFMPANNEWSAEQLMKVFDNDRILRARSVWNNVILEFWPNGIKETPRGYLTKLTFTYENQTIDGPVQTLFPYPNSN